MIVASAAEVLFEWPRRVTVQEDTSGRRWICEWGEGTAPISTWTEPPQPPPYPLTERPR